MAPSEPATDAIRHLVEEVLRRIRTEAAAAPASSPSPPVKASPAAAQPAVGATAGATIGERVVTLELVARLPAGTRQVTVPARAVVTPSARDFARDKGIVIVHASAASAGTPATAARPFVVAHADCVGDVAARAAAIVRSVPGAWQIPPSGLADVLQAIATHASRDGARAVLLTGRPTAAVILANRHPSVRGISGRDAAAVNAAATETAANLLIVHPRDFVGGGLERLCAGFAARDTGPVPAELAAAPAPAKPCACASHAH